MKRCLVDVNVWLALIVRQHRHHQMAREWFEALGPGDGGLCRMVHLALIRLLGNRSIMGATALSASAAWNLIGALFEDERVEFVPEPAGVDAILPTLFNYAVPTGKLVTDAYLAAVAMAGSRRLVTIDRGFRAFRGLEVDLLAG